MTDAIIYKDEGDFGPVWIRRDGALKCYRDSGERDFTGEPVPQWYTRAEATAIARDEGLPLEEG